jgi:hypothetical protein
VVFVSGNSCAARAATPRADKANCIGFFDVHNEKSPARDGMFDGSAASTPQSLGLKR